MTTGGFGVPRVSGLADECTKISRELDQLDAQLHDLDGAFGHDDAHRLDQLALRVEDLHVQHRWAPSESHESQDVPGHADLESMYEAPFGIAVGDMLDRLTGRVQRLRELAWRHVGIPLDPGPAPKAIAGPGHGQPIEVALAPEAPIHRRRADPTDRRTADPWRIAAEVLTALGVLLVLFFVHVTYSSGLQAARSQRDLDREFNSYLRAQVALADATANEGEQESGILGGGSEDDAESEAADVEASDYPVLPAPGDPVAIVSMPTVGARDVVVEGTTSARLTAGPGHLRSTPLPGRAGNAVIFGRRTTYGAPFQHLEGLRPGDPIDVVTVDGLFRYIVQSVERVGSGDPDPIGSTFSNRLTLVTADERFSAGGRLVAIALLDGSPAASPVTADGRTIPLPSTGDEDIGTERTGTDWALLLVWTQVMVVVYLGARWLYRHWLPWSAWIVSTPVLLLIAFAWLDSLSRLLPSTL